MYYLAIVSLIWAFSFGLIGNALAGIDSIFAATTRLGIAGIIFLPFFRASKVPPNSAIRLLLCGAFQFGVMYVCYMQAFQYLPSHLVALFSILTPLYIVLINDFRRRNCHHQYLFGAILSIAGAAIIKVKTVETSSIWIGFALMQGAGLAFGYGQIYYRDWKRSHPEVKDHQVFALLYIGGFLIAAIASAIFTNWDNTQLSKQQALVLVYLGVVASGFGFFFWNKGASLSKAGTLAAFNNAVVPLAMFCSLFVFGEISQVTGDALLRLTLGGACILGALLVTEKSPGKS